MSKFLKVCLIVATSLLGIGLIISGICFFIGGRGMFREGYEAVRSHIDLEIPNVYFPDTDIPGVHVVGLDKQIEFDYSMINDNYEVLSGDFTREISTEKAEKINMAFGGGKLEFETWDGDQFKIEGENVEKAQFYVKDGVLQILCVVQHNSHKNMRVKVFIPSVVDLDNVEIDFGAGEAKVESIKANTLNISAGAAEIEVEEVTCDMLIGEVGAGSLKFKDTVTNDATLSVGMGSIKYKGAINGDADVECAMGNIDMDLDGEFEDHAFYSDCAMGVVTIEGRNYAGINEIAINKEVKDSKITIDCAMGSVKIDF